ncbi:MAG TPA: tRNA (adenosine(37)-N6)-dimethylallyltransferase MiaA [Chloroflexi bacterium]|jgi:tRNA dimethylallyltransferase|nr:tRNA (adenosine(37)-N6)-dimethylallyltransferase MiaA [Chloroflexota bacterium]
MTIPVLVIVGPTAVGKTTLAIVVGQQVGGEAVSADSRQIYRYMDIGTAKPTAEEQAALPHHLIDVVDPDERLTLAQYKEMADRAIREIHSRGKLPILVGGTGLYVRAVTEGWTIPEVPPNEALRARLEALAEQTGHEALHDELARVDPSAAKQIDARNVRRVIRALEVYHETGHPISQLQAKSPPDYDLLRVGLTMPRPRLYARIDERIHHMIERGLVDEVRSLLARGYDADLAAMSGLGYREIARHLRGEISLDDAITLMKRHTRRFVRQQYNWFRLDDPAIQWFDAAPLDVPAVQQRVLEFIHSR